MPENRLSTRRARPPALGGTVVRADALICDHCNEAIGVYEPIVVVVDDRPVRTSRLTAPGKQLTGEPRFHEACFTAGKDPPRVDR